MASYRGLALPARALRTLGLPAHADLQEARRAHRSLSLKLHPDVSKSSAAEDGAVSRIEQLVIVNAARESIEAAARAMHQPATGEERRQWDETTKRIHMLSMTGSWDQVLEAISCGVNPNVLTPAQGAPPIFYASCCDWFGNASVGQGDSGRLQVLEVFAACPAVDLSLKGSSMWAQGRTIYDLIALGRCREAALERLVRGQQSLQAVIAKGLAHRGSGGSLCLAE